VAINQLPSGAYRARLMIDGQTYRQVFSLDGRSPEEAFAAAREWETLTRARHIQGTLYGPTTVNQYAAGWLSGYDVGPSATKRFHETNVRLYIQPALGTRPIAKVTPTDVTRLLNTVRQTVSAAKVDSVYRTLSALLRSAEQDDLCSKSPVRSKKHRPRRQKPEMIVLERGQARALLQALDGWKRDTALLQLALGARFGEVAGLTPHDIIGNRIRIVRRVTDGTVAATKNRKRRELELPQAVRTTIDRLIEQACNPEPLPDLGDREWAAEPWRRHWLIQTSTGNPPSLSAYNKTLKETCSAAEIPVISSHGLRHTYVSWMIDEGYSADQIAFWIGDTPATVQTVYAHMLEGSSTPAAVAIDNALGELE